MEEQYKKIHILELEPASDLGGVTHFIARIVQYLPKDFAVHFAASDDGPALALMQQYHVTTHSVDTNYGFFTLRQTSRKLRALLTQKDIAIVHAHTVRAGLLSVVAVKGTETKVVFTAHGWRYKQLRNPLKRALLFFIERYIVRHADAVTYLTHQEYMIGKRLAPQNQHIVIPISLDMKEYEGHQQNEGKFNVAMIGRMTYQKDPMTFLATAALLKDEPIQFSWIGEGELQDDMKQYVERNKLQGTVSLLGQRSHAGLITFLHTTDVLFFTSHFEGLPIVILEAMAAGVPVVAAAVSGIPEIIENGKNGFLFKEGDAGGAAKKIMELYNDKAKRIQFAQVSRALIEKDFSPIEKCSERFSDLYHHMYATNH